MQTIVEIHITIDGYYVEIWHDGWRIDAMDLTNDELIERRAMWAEAGYIED